MAQQAVTIPKEVEEELTLLRGFKDLVAERTGYMFGAKALSTTMSDKTEKQRKDVTDKGKSFKKPLKPLSNNPTKNTAPTF